jgi:hypothetical protein
MYPASKKGFESAEPMKQRLPQKQLALFRRGVAQRSPNKGYPSCLKVILAGSIGCSLWLGGCKNLRLGQSSPEPSNPVSPSAIASSPQSPSVSPSPISPSPINSSPISPNPVTPEPPRNSPRQPAPPTVSASSEKSPEPAEPSAETTDTEILSNANWTITISNLQSWTGVNNTGNLTYYGCDRQNNCLRLTGGTVACREGFCNSGWVNGDYRYIVRTRMSENPDEPSELVVQQGDRTILHETGLQ